MVTPGLTTLLYVFLKCEGEDDPTDWNNNIFPWYIYGRGRYVLRAGLEKFHMLISTSKDLL